MKNKIWAMRSIIDLVTAPIWSVWSIFCGRQLLYGPYVPLLSCTTVRIWTVLVHVISGEKFTSDGRADGTGGRDGWPVHEFATHEHSRTSRLTICPSHTSGPACA